MWSVTHDVFLDSCTAARSPVSSFEFFVQRWLDPLFSFGFLLALALCAACLSSLSDYFLFCCRSCYILARPTARLLAFPLPRFDLRR